MSFELAVQTAVYDKLKAHTGYPANLVGIYDMVPQKLKSCDTYQDSQFPFVTIGEAIHEEFDTFTSLGNTVVITIHTWSRFRGRKEIKTIQGQIYEALHRRELSYTGYDLISCDALGSETFYDADGLTIHGVQTFRILIGKIGS